MTARFPQGLVRVVNATHVEDPSDPADVIYLRKQALHNFWKVHDVQAKASRDAVNIRCSQLFWRVWGDRRLSVGLGQDTLMQLWLAFQRDFDLTPFHLQIKDSSNDKGKGKEVATISSSYTLHRCHSKESSDGSVSTISVSPRYPAINQQCGQNGHTTSAENNFKAPADSEPGNLARSDSNETRRKRPSGSTGSSRGRIRPSLPRKRSSQAERPPEPSKPRKSIMRSPRTSNQGTGGFSTPQEQDNGGNTARPSPNATAMQPIPTSRISDFELPSASSWQSIDSHLEPPAKHSPQNEDLLIDRNFRERFMEKTRNSSTNLAGMNRAMRKTGSVVRFADEVELASGTPLRKSISATDRKSAPTSPQSVLRASSESHVTKTYAPSETSEVRPWRPSGIERHDSVGSVAAVSDDGAEDLEPRGEADALPRTRSQLSLGIADLKRTLSSGNLEDLRDNENAITSPTIEEEQEALITGQRPKRLTKDEENLLAMGRKDGVTVAGGVNLPNNLTVKGKFKMVEFDDDAEESHF